MENLQNEVAALLEKCAKYKVGQTVYRSCTNGYNQRFIESFEITQIAIRYPATDGTYEVFYKGSGSFDEFPEVVLFDTLDGMKGYYVTEYASSWDADIDKVKTKESQEKAARETREAEKATKEYKKGSSFGFSIRDSVERMQETD